MNAVPDTTLVQAARAGDGVAYGELFQRYQRRIYNYAYGIAGNAEDAADVAQEAFVRVFQALPRLDGEVNFSAYLYRTAHNVAVDAVKRGSRYIPSEDLDMEPEPGLRVDPERTTLLQEQQRQTWQAAFLLTEKHREILTLRELHDMSYADIAQVMDMPRSTVGVLLSRARLKFKEEFRMSSVDIEQLSDDCRDMLPLLSAYIDAELEEAKRVRVQAHLEECAFCRLALEEMIEASRSYRAIVPIIPPAMLGDEVWTRLGQGAPATVDAPGFGSPKGSEHTGGPVEVAGTLSGPIAAGSAGTGARAGRWGGLLTAKALGLIAAGVVALLFGVAVVSGFAPGLWGSEEESRSAGQPVVQLDSSGTTASEPTTIPSAAAVTSTVGAAAFATTHSSSPAQSPSTSPSASTSAAADGAEANSASVADDAAAEAPASTPDTQPPSAPQPLSPADGSVVRQDDVTLEWQAVSDPSGVTYTVQVQTYDPTTGSFSAGQSVGGLTATSVAHALTAPRERWRVMAVDGAGNAGPASAWWSISRRPAAVVPVEPVTPLVPLEPLRPATTATTTGPPTIY